MEPLQTGGNENAIFAGQWHNVGDGAERDQIEQRPQIKIRRARQTGFASAFDQSMGEFEREADGTKFGKDVGVPPSGGPLHSNRLKAELRTAD